MNTNTTPTIINNSEQLERIVDLAQAVVSKSADLRSVLCWHASDAELITEALAAFDDASSLLRREALTQLDAIATEVK